MSYSITPESEEVAASNIDAAKLEQLMLAKQAEQSLPLALLAGLAAAIVSSVIWAAITYKTGYQIGFMAVGVGFLVGYGVKYLGKGMTSTFGIIGAAFALFGCLFGNLLTALVALSQIEGSSFGLVLSAFLTSPGLVIDIMVETFSPIDLLFYAIAVYEGYKLSFSGLTEEELASVQRPESLGQQVPEG